MSMNIYRLPPPFLSFLPPTLSLLVLSLSLSLSPHFIYLLIICLPIDNASLSINNTFTLFSPVFRKSPDSNPTPADLPDSLDFFQVSVLLI